MPNVPFDDIASEAFRQGRFQLGVSFRFGRARGAFCHAGWCQQCKVALADGRTGLACRMPATANAVSQRGTPWRKPVSACAHLLRPWFHERVLLPHPALRQAFLGFLRNASGALPLGKPVEGSGISRTASCDTLVIGGGVSGSAAAESLQASDVDVLVVDEGPDPDPVERRSRGLRRSHGTTALGLYRGASGSSTALCSVDGGTLLVSFQRLVVATGSYDRMLTIPGNDLPGIVGLQAFERLAAARRIPNDCVLGLYAPARTARQARVAADAANLRFGWAAGPADLDPEIAGTVHLGAHVAAALGSARLRGVTLGDGRRMECDVLVVGFQQPTYEFQIQAGQRARYVGPGAAIQVTGDAEMPLLAVGAAAGVGENAAELAREAVTDWLAGGRPTGAIFAFEPIPGSANPADEVIVCPCEDVRVGDVRAALRDGYDGIEHLKRRTGAATGPCQGKLCHPLLLQCLAEQGSAPTLPTMRPLVRPTALSTFAGGGPRG